MEISWELISFWVLPVIWLVHFSFSAAASSLLKVRFSHFSQETVEEQLGEKSFGRRLVTTGDDTHQLLRLGRVLSLVLFSWLAIPLVAGWLATLYSPESSSWGQFSALGLSLLTVSILYYVLAELVPYWIGLTAPVRVLRLGGGFVCLWTFLLRPLYAIAHGIARLGWKLFRHDAPPDLNSLELEEQIEQMRSEEPEMSFVAHLILKNALSMRDLVVADVLLPRNQVKYFDLNSSLEENLAMARETGHTRFPLCFGDLDRCLGLIHIKDLFRHPGPISSVELKKIKRNMIRIDSEEPLEAALTKLLSHKMHMALVIDEFRGTEGVLTLERILEQLVGDIRDEFDADEEALIQTEPNAREAIVSGLMPLHELEGEFGVELENDEVSTLSGLVTSTIGRIPEEGENLSVGPLLVEVLEVDDTRIIQARVQIAPNPSEESQETQE